MSTSRPAAKDDGPPPAIPFPRERAAAAAGDAAPDDPDHVPDVMEAFNAVSRKMNDLARNLHKGSVSGVVARTSSGRRCLLSTEAV